MSRTSAVINSSSDPTIRHIPKFGGELWFVDGAVVSSGDGKTPDAAFKTIGEAISACAVADAITVRAGTYTEAGLNLNKASVELWFESGTIIQPATGTALIVSGANCRLRGIHRIVPAAGEIGLQITGSFCHAEHGRVQTGGTGIQITGSGSIVENYACGNQTAVGYDIQGGQARLTNCKTVGAGATYGYKINNGAATGVLDNCTSVGHATSGFYIATGSADWTILNCSSGHGDGKWHDIDNANVWSNFQFEHHLYSTSTFNGATRYNIFKVTGAVRVHNIYGHVTTQIANTSSLMNLELGSAGGYDNITSLSGAPNIQADVVNTCYAKLGPTNEELLKGSPDDAPAVVEEISSADPNNPIILIQQNGADTYIQVELSEAVASGAIHWHVEWEPITDDGMLVPV